METMRKAALGSIQETIGNDIHASNQLLEKLRQHRDVSEALGASWKDQF